MTVGVLTSLDVAPIYLGEEQGFFEEEGLELTFEIAQGRRPVRPTEGRRRSPLADVLGPWPGRGTGPAPCRA